MKTDIDITVRPIGVRELYQVAQYIPAFYEEFGGHPMGQAYEYDPDAFIVTWIDWLRQPNYVLLGAFDGDKWIGGLGGMINKHPYTIDTLMGIEHFWYVVKEYRKSGVGKKLIDAFEAWLKERGVKYMIMLYINGGPSEMMAKFYEKEGFVPMEQQVCKEVR